MRLINNTETSIPKVKVELSEKNQFYLPSTQTAPRICINKQTKPRAIHHVIKEKL